MIRRHQIVQVTVILSLALACPVGRGIAQDLVDGNASDLDDFRTSFRNPAALAFMPNQFVFGSKAYDVGLNPGFFDLSNGYVSYYSPYWRKRFGLNGQFLRTGIFDMTGFGFSYSERPHPSIAVGGRLDILNQGFDRDRFQNVDPGDPLLQSGLSRNYYSIALGVFVLPVPELSIGAVAENINGPNVALSGEDHFHLPVGYDVGIQYRAERLHPSLSLRYEDGAYRLRVRMGVVLTEDLMARLEYQREKIGLEGNIRLYRGLNLNYRYHYPLNELNTFSSGSHSLSFVYDFTRVLDIPDLLDVEYTPEPVEPSRSRDPIPVRGDFLVLASVPSLEIREKNITRRLDDDIPIDFVRRNYRKIFGVDGGEPVAGEEEVGTFAPDTLTGLVGSYSKEYRSTIDSLSTYLAGEEMDEAKIISPEQELLRAGNIKDVIVRNTRISPEKIIIVRESPRPAGTAARGAGDGPAAGGDPANSAGDTVGDTVADTRGETAGDAAAEGDTMGDTAGDTAAVGDITGDTAGDTTGETAAMSDDPSAPGALRADSTPEDEVDLSLLNRTETRIDLSEERVVFQVIALNRKGNEAPWSLVIHDSNGRTVKDFSGSAGVPRRIEWDWLDEEGTLVRPGWYSYRLRWTEEDGGMAESQVGRLFVKKNKKDITIELTRKWTRKAPEARRIEVQMNR